VRANSQSSKNKGKITIDNENKGKNTKTPSVKYPYYIILGYTPVKGTLGIFVESLPDRCASITSPLHLHSNLAITLRVLRFEVFESPRLTPA
jgi:hypothetical protein